jgi:hypothetical protein
MLDHSSQWLPGACGSVGAEDVARGNEVEIFSDEAKSTRDIGRDSWESKTSGDVRKREVDDLIWVTHAPIVDVDEEFVFSLSKINDSLVVS